MSNVEVMAYSYKTIFLILSILWINVITGCGVKGPPVAPGYVDPPAVRDLSYRVAGGKLVLSWTLPTVEGAQSAKFASVGVHRLKQAMGNRECPDCPQVFARVAKLAARSGTMTYTDRVSPGFQYYYKIILSDTSDRTGGDSNIVHYIYEGNSQ